MYHLHTNLLKLFAKMLQSSRRCEMKIQIVEHEKDLQVIIQCRQIDEQVTRLKSYIELFDNKIFPTCCVSQFIRYTVKNRVNYIHRHYRIIKVRGVQNMGNRENMKNREKWFEVIQELRLDNTRKQNKSTYHFGHNSCC